MLIPVEFVIGLACAGLEQLLEIFSSEDMNSLVCAAHLQAFVAARVFKIMVITCCGPDRPQRPNTPNPIAMPTKSSQAKPRVKAKMSGEAAAQQCWREGLQLSLNGDWLRAEQAFRRAHQYCPADVVYLLNLARAETKNGGADLALQSLQTLLALEPANELARNMAVDLLNQQHRYAEAAACMARQPEQVLRTAEYFQNLGEALFNANSYK
ncbi:hypothetical protein ACVBEH_20560, partial [Roseateles sp. GG27B]